MSKSKKGKSSFFKGKHHSEETKKKLSIINLGEKHPLFGSKHSEETKERMSKSQKGSGKITISKIKKKYPFFSQIEEMRYNPDKPGEKEIQVHCKNHNCPNSKEKDGWFTPTMSQYNERRRALSKHGTGGSYFYCSDKCKNECPLYRFNPYRELQKENKTIEFPYTQEEYFVWRQTVLEQDNYTCQICGSKENLHCHHIEPVKLKPEYSLDPENGIFLCEKCHYKYGHKDECSTGQLSKMICNNRRVIECQ